MARPVLILIIIERSITIDVDTRAYDELSSRPRILGIAGIRHTHRPGRFMGDFKMRRRRVNRIRYNQRLPVSFGILLRIETALACLSSALTGQPSVSLLV